ncbi:MAG: hypothetical protein Q8K68_01740 [Nitrospirota bacterium]|nr:hypothetical protein [Nitrospirota bacterium]
MLYADIFNKLAEERINYAVTGGIALVLHGVVRFTADLDLIVDLSKDNLKRFVKVMGELGYRPKQPVPADDLCSPEARRRWADEKHMVVFSFYHPEKPVNLVDVFITEQLSFPIIEKELVWFEAGNVKIPVVSKTHLIQLKQIAGRPQDIADIEILEELVGEKKKP